MIPHDGSPLAEFAPDLKRLIEGGTNGDAIDFSGIWQRIIDTLKARLEGFEIGGDVKSILGEATGGTAGTPPAEGGSPFFPAPSDGFNFAAGPAADALLNQIRDYMVGDRVAPGRESMFEAIMNEAGDRFGEIYGTSIGGELPIRIRHEQTDDARTLIIETDFDRDGIYEPVDLSGRLPGDLIFASENI